MVVFHSYSSYVISNFLHEKKGHPQVTRHPQVPTFSTRLLIFRSSKARFMPCNAMCFCYFFVKKYQCTQKTWEYHLEMKQWGDPSLINVICSAKFIFFLAHADWFTQSQLSALTPCTKLISRLQYIATTSLTSENGLLITGVIYNPIIIISKGHEHNRHTTDHPIFWGKLWSPAFTVGRPLLKRHLGA